MKNYFSETTRILENALNSINEDDFDNLLEECYLTIENGKKLIVSGLGKNVPICDKFVGTMLSLGLNANFLHTNSAVHGDMGMVKDGDLVILLTKSGSTQESVYLANLLLERQTNIWLLTFNKDGVLSKQLKKKIIIDLEHEGDKWNIMPNNSSLLNLIFLQTLAMKLADKLELTLNDFKRNHPGGAIGDKLKNEL